MADTHTLTVSLSATLRFEAEERERWFREEIVAAHEEYLGDPSSALTIEELKRDLANARVKHKAQS